MAGSVANGEAALTGTVNEMCDGVRNGLHVGLCFVECQSARRALVTILANQRVYFGLFAESLEAGSDNEQLAAVGDGHAGSIDGLVRDPGGVELIGLHYGDNFFNGLVEDGD